MHRFGSERDCFVAEVDVNRLLSSSVTLCTVYRSCSTQYSNLSFCRSVHLLLLVPSFLTIASSWHQHTSIRTLPTSSCSSLVVPRGPRRSHVVLGRTDHVFLSFLLHRRIVRFPFPKGPRCRFGSSRVQQWWHPGTNPDRHPREARQVNTSLQERGTTQNDRRA